MRVEPHDTFELAYRRYMDEGGHSYDEWDIAAHWGRYQESPQTYSLYIFWIAP